jgi:hypothetical protein
MPSMWRRAGRRDPTPLAGAHVSFYHLLRDDPNARIGSHNGRDRRRSFLKPEPACET